MINEPFPLPNYLIGQGYRKCELDGKIFYVPLINIKKPDSIKVDDKKYFTNEAANKLLELFIEPDQYIIDGRSDPHNVIITAICGTDGKEFLLPKTDKTKTTIIVSILVIFIVGWFGNDSNKSDYALEELAKNGKYQQEEAVGNKRQKLKGIQSPQIDTSIINEETKSPF